MAHPYFRVHVCQASYGDCLALEIDDECPVDPANYQRIMYNEGQRDQNQPATNPAVEYQKMMTSPTRRVMLLDGGPAFHGPTGLNIETRSPLQSMYFMLNTLLPPYDDVQPLDTIITTHDDADHMNGIFQLLVNMLEAKKCLKNLSEQREISDLEEFTYIKGAIAAARGETVAKNIWHNSADNVVKFWCSKNINFGPIPIFSTRGYFDQYLQDLSNPMAILPDFNAEWKDQPIDATETDPVVLINDATAWGGARAVKATDKRRGHVRFEFIGPNSSLLNELGNKYFPENKYGNRTEKKPQGKTLPKKPIDNKNIEPLAVSEKQQQKAMLRQSTNIAKELTNDPSVKNRSSLTFNARTNNSQSVFLGDATAIDSFLEKWDGKPKHITVMKVMHHGSKANNYWPEDAVERRVNELGGAAREDYEKYLEGRAEWEYSIWEHNKNDKHIDLILSEQRKVSLFFDNVRAQKYIISASHVGHPNPHLSTLVGIISRAVRFPDRTTKKPVDIYLTNFISNETWFNLAAFWGCLKNILKETIPGLFKVAGEEVDIGKWDPMGTYYRLWILRPSQSFGTVLIDPDDDDVSANYHWIRASPSNEEFIAWWHQFYSSAAPFSCLPKSNSSLVGKSKKIMKVPKLKPWGAGGNKKGGKKNQDTEPTTKKGQPRRKSSLLDPDESPLTMEDTDSIEMLLLRTYYEYIQDREAYIRNTNIAFQFLYGSLNSMVEQCQNHYNLAQQSRFNNMQPGYNQGNFNGGLLNSGGGLFPGNAFNQGSGNNLSFIPNQGGGIPYPYIYQGGGNALPNIPNQSGGNLFTGIGGGSMFSNFPSQGGGDISGTLFQQQQQQNYSQFFQQNTNHFYSLMAVPPTGLMSSMAFESPQKKSISPEIQQISTSMAQEPMIPKASSKKRSGNSSALGRDELSLIGIYYSVPWETLNKFNITGDEFDYYPLIMPKMRIIKSLDGLFTELVRVKLSTAPNVEMFKQSYQLRGGPSISDFATFILGGLSGAKPLLQCLPMSIPSDTTAWIDPLKNPYCSQIDPDSVVSAFVDSKTDPSIESPGSGPQQIKFTIKPSSDAGLMWLIPNSSGFLGKVGLDVLIPEGIDITIYWPTVPDNTVIYGTFKGVLQNMGGRNVVCEFLVMPDEKVTPPQYNFQFADEKFQTKGYTMNFIDIAKVFAAATLGIYLDIDEIDLPGLDSLKPLVDTIKELKLVEPGFTLQKDSPYNQDIQLRNVFGTFEILTNRVWAPFGDLIKFSSPKVRLVIDNLTSPQERQVMLNIYERMEISGFPVPLAFETKKIITGARIYRLKFAPEDGHPVTVFHIFNLLSLSMLDKNELPDFLVDGLEALSLRSFTLGWESSPATGGKVQKFSAVPSFLELVINVGSIDIVKDVLGVENALVRLQVFNPGNKKLRKIAVTSAAAIDIAGVPMNTRFRDGGPPIPPPITDPFLNKGSEEPVISFEIACKDTPLTFHDVLKSLVAKPPTLPGWLNDAITNVGLENFSIETVKDANGKQLIRSAAVDISLWQETIHICDGLEMEDPHLQIVTKYPGDASRRLVMCKFSTEMLIGDSTTMVQIGCSFGTEKALVLHIGAGAGVPVGQLISHFAKKFAASLDFEFPSALDGFKTIMLGETLIVFDDQTNDNKLSLASIDFNVFSGYSLELWDEPKVQLTDFKLTYSYEKDTATEITFNCALQLGTAVLSTALTYEKVMESSDKKDTSGKELVPGTYITAAASYDKKISVFDVVKSLSGIDLAEKLKSAGIEALKDFVDIQIWEVELTLARTPEYSRVAFGAKTNWLIFESIRMSATNEDGWGFSVGFSLKDDVLSLIPVVKDSLGKLITLTDTEVALFIKDLDPLVFTQLNKMKLIPDWAKGGHGFGLAVSTKLSLNTKEMGILKEWIGKAELEILGIITAHSLSLGVYIGELNLFEDSIQVQGSVLVSYDKSGPFIGVGGDFSFNLPVVSKEKITGNVKFGVNLMDFGLAFKLTIAKPLPDLFGIKGLQVSNFAVGAVFPPQQKMVPSQIEFSGKLSIQSLNDVKGDLQVQWIQKDPSSCYLSATVENLNLSKILAIFARGLEVSSAITDVLDNNGIDVKKLALEIVPKDMSSVDGTQVKKQGIRFEGNLSILLDGLNLWSAYSLIDISISRPKFVVEAMMSPIKPFPETDQIFSIGRDNSNPKESDPSLKIASNKKLNLNQDMLKNGPIFHISTEEIEKPVFISGKLVIFGVKEAIRVEVKKEGFSFHRELTAPSGDTVELDAKCEFKSKLALSGTIAISTFPEVSLPLDFINSAAGTKQTTPVNGKVKFIMNTGWSQATAGFKLTLSGSLTTLGRDWEIASFDITVSPEDVDNISKIADKFAEQFASEAKSLVSKFIKDQGLEEAVKFINDQFDEVVQNKDVVKFVSDVKGIRSPEDLGNIAKYLVSIGNLGQNDASTLLRDLGLSPTAAGSILSGLFGGVTFPIPGPGGPPGYFPGGSTNFPFATPSPPVSFPSGPSISWPSVIPGFGFKFMTIPDNGPEPGRAGHVNLNDSRPEAEEQERARNLDLEAQGLHNLYQQGQIGLSEFQQQQMQLEMKSYTMKFDRERKNLDEAFRNGRIPEQEYRVAIANIETQQELSMAAMNMGLQVQQGNMDPNEANVRLQQAHSMKMTSIEAAPEISATPIKVMTITEASDTEIITQAIPLSNAVSILTSMKQGGYSCYDLAVSAKEVFGCHNPSAAESLLMQAGYGQDEVSQAIQAVYS